MFLGIEVGGTKLQLGVGDGHGRIVELVRRDVQPDRGADAILAQIDSVARVLAERHHVAAAGYGFGGPVDAVRGRVVKSHQVDGWEGFPLVEWTRQRLSLPIVLANDCDAAALAEARFGAGRGRAIVLFVTVGTGIGGGLVIRGDVYRGAGLAVTEIGHLRPGLDAALPDSTVEALASGPGIVADIRRSLAAVTPTTGLDAADLLDRCGGRMEDLTAKMVAEAAGQGNQLAVAAYRGACRALGWAIAQAITLVSPEIVVVGGGVSLAPPRLFLEPLRDEVRRYVFPPLAGSYQILPAALGEEVVVHGALALAGCIAP